MLLIKGLIYEEKKKLAFIYVSHEFVKHFINLNFVHNEATIYVFGKVLKI